MGIDKTIWVLIESGDEGAYEEMYVYYFKRFYIYGQKITTYISLIEDSLQETMIKIWQNRSALSSITHPDAYFYISFRNLLISKLRAQGSIVSDEFVKEEISNSSEYGIIHKEENLAMSARLERASGFLTNRQKEAIFLRFYEELSYEEVAVIMGITTKAAYKIMARALKELKDKYVHLFIILFYLDFFF